MAWTTDSLQKEIDIRAKQGIDTTDLRRKLTEMVRGNALPVNDGVRPTVNNKPVQGSMNFNPTTQTTTFGNIQSGATQTKTPTLSTPTQPTTTSTPQQAPQQTYDPKTELEALKKAQIANAVASLNNKYNQVIGDINSKKTQLPYTYDAKKLSAQSDSALQAKNFAEFLANRGLTRSGTSQQAELMRNMQLQSTLNSYDKQQADELAYLQKQADAAKQALNSDIVQAESGAEANYINNLIKYKAEQDTQRKAEALKREELAQQKELKYVETLQDLIDKQKQRSNEAYKAFIDNQKTQADIQDKSISRQLQLSGLTGNVPVELILNNISPDEIAMYQNIPDYAAVIQQTDNPTQKAILNYFRNQKIANNADLLAKYGNTMTQSYIPTQSALQSDRNYNLDVGKFNYGVDKDNRDFNYTAGRDNVKDRQWMYDYGLRDYVAKDNSSRGWANNAIAQQNANTSAYNAETSRYNADTSRMNYELKAKEPTETNKEYARRIDNELKNIESDYFNQVGDSNIQFLAPNKEGSVERKELFDRFVRVLANSDLTPQQRDERLTGKFSKWEIENWMK